MQSSSLLRVPGGIEEPRLRSNSLTAIPTSPSHSEVVVYAAKQLSRAACASTKNPALSTSTRARFNFWEKSSTRIICAAQGLRRPCHVMKKTTRGSNERRNDKAQTAEGRRNENDTGCRVEGEQ